jgi:hypothetical protein
MEDLEEATMREICYIDKLVSKRESHGEDITEVALRESKVMVTACVYTIEFT